MKVNKPLFQFMAAYLIAALGLLLIATALFLPPMGVIDPTVLTAFGEILTFSGALLGMDYHYRYNNGRGGGELE